MLSTYKYPQFAYVTPPEQREGGRPSRYPVVVVGAGPVGLCAAIDLAQSGTPVVLLDEDNTVSLGSRGVCYAKRALEVLDRLGVGDAVVAKGVSWNVGRTFFREEEVYNFNLLPTPDHKRPGMVNLQQYYLEEFLVKRAGELKNLDLRWKNKVTAVSTVAPGSAGSPGSPAEGGVTLQVETPDGAYALETDWLIVADGARSPIRKQMGLEVEGKVFQDRFLIADVVMKAEFPVERWFWFDPHFHPGQSALLHRQADNVWRLDFQLGWQADPEEEKKPEKVIPRINAMLGDRLGQVPEYELEWVSVYTFQCRRMHDFHHGRVLFIGDAAHQVSPFGARGANSGIQDADNLVWKLKLVMEGKAPPTLLDSYNVERGFAADENLLNSTRSTDFITPKSKTSLTFRNAVLMLAREHAFARALVNSGRLSVPSVLTDSPLNTPDTEGFVGDMVPGAPLDDAPLRERGRNFWLLDRVGNHFVALCYVEDPSRLDEATARVLRSLTDAAVPVEPILVAVGGGVGPAGLRVFEDHTGRFAERFDARPGTVYLVRPDQHVVGRWRGVDANALRAAVERAIGKAEPAPRKADATPRNAEPTSHDASAVRPA